VQIDQPAVETSPQIETDSRPLFGLAEITAYINQLLDKDFDEKTIAGWCYRGILETKKFGHRRISSTGAIRRQLLV
jgi:hypothetical protein